MPKTPLTDAFVADIRSAFPDAKVKVYYTYSGSGDEGWFDGYEVKIDDVGISHHHVDALRNGKESWYLHSMGAEEKKVCTIIVDIESRHNQEKIETELYDILEQREAGWEINEGSDGAFVFYPDGTRKHEHSENIMSTEERYRDF